MRSATFASRVIARLPRAVNRFPQPRASPHARDCSAASSATSVGTYLVGRRAQSSLSSSLTGIDFLGFFAGGTRDLPPTGVGERGAGPMPRGGGTGVAAREEAVVARAAGWSKLAMCHAFVW